MELRQPLTAKDSVGPSIQAGSLSILDQLDAIVYVADTVTHELLFVNRYAQRLYGPVQDRACWQYLHPERGGPCEFCSSRALVDVIGRPARARRWEFQCTRNGRWYDLLEQDVRWLDDRPARMGIAFDITKRKRQEKQALYLARHDPLTGLPNRAAVQAVLDKVHADAQRHSTPYTVLLLDLDRFKLINDNFGHSAGDRVLEGVVRVIEAAVRRSDWVGRWGGEEFICVLPGAERPESVEIAERVRAQVEAHPIEWDSQRHEITCSVGMGCLPEDGGSIDELLTAADSTLYEAKRTGRNRVVSGPARRRGLLSIAGQIQSALRESRVVAAYQPIVDLQSRHTVGEEALARIASPQAGEQQEAGTFIEAASHLQLTHRIDHAVICSVIERCTCDVLTGRTLLHFVNVSADFLRHAELVADVMERMRTACGRCSDLLGGDKPLVIEVSESELQCDAGRAREALGPFLEFGLRVAVDDFGAGSSSFRYLADLPVSFLKIDGELVRRVRGEGRARTIVGGIGRLAAELGVRTIAEAVEDAETAAILGDLGIGWAQGYYFGTPSTG